MPTMYLAGSHVYCVSAVVFVTNVLGSLEVLQPTLF